MALQTPVIKTLLMQFNSFRSGDITNYYAQKHSVTSPKSAVKSLAEYSRSKAEILDLWVSIYRATGWGYALDNIKGITQDVIEKTAGYVKGLIDYTIP